MEEPVRQKRRVRTRVRHRRSVKLALLCLGATGLVLGTGLCLTWPLIGNPKLLRIGVWYVLASLAILAARQVMVLLTQRDRHEARSD